MEPKKTKPSNATPNDEPNWSWSDGLLAFDVSLTRDDTFKPAGVRGVLNRDHFLNLLNHFRDEPGEVFKLTPGGSLIDGIRRRKAVVSPWVQLRFYIDEWLDTGVELTGVEDPRKRDLTQCPNASSAVRRFAIEQPLRIEPTRAGLDLQFPSETSARRLRPPESAIDTADRYLALFFLCDWRRKLAKCRELGCGGSYFELKHWNRVYKRGTVCPKCQRKRSLKSATRATATTREVAEGALYALAASRFRARLEAAEWHQDPKLKTKIIEFLNARIQKSDSLKFTYPHGITGKWLSWTKNRNGIAKAAKGEDHAES